MTRNFLVQLFFLHLPFLSGNVVDPTVQLFEWSWKDVANECETFLSKKGYKSVQISPPQEHIQGSDWWTRYQPVTYRLVSRSGNEDDFKDMVRRCLKVGVTIIADSVINHMAAGSGTGTDGSSYSNRTYSSYGQNDFHHYPNDPSANCVIDDYDNQENVQTCDLVSLPDLCTGCDYVQTTIADYINNMASMGVGGIRIDAAKHQNADELKGIIAKLKSGLYINQEVIGTPGEAVQPSMYYDLGHVTEFAYSSNLDVNIINQNKMNELKNLGSSGLIPSDIACAFLDNHDTQRNGDAMLTYKDGGLYYMASMFMLAYPYGDVRVMSSYYFSDSNTDAGPPGVGVENGANCNDGKNWVCEHRHATIANMVAWRHQAGGNSHGIEHWQQGNGNQIAFSRNGKAFVAFNRDNNSWQTTLQTGLPEGTYCDVLNSLDGDDPKSCSKKYTVNSDGTSTIEVPPVYAVAMHAGAKV